MTDPTRPALRWHGGKWRLAPWIIAHFPSHQKYVEPFGGAYSVGLRKPQVASEIYNDLDDVVVRFFSVLRDPESARELITKLRLTPFSRTEFERSYELAEDPIEDARRLVIRSFQGFGSDGACSPYRTGFRADSGRRGSSPAEDWAGYPDCLALVVSRLAGVTIERRPAVDVMRKHDGRDTLHYVDPPYLHTTRQRVNRSPAGGTYRHELSGHDHAELLETLCELDGMIAISGYPSALYDDALADWQRNERKALADGARARVEVLWLNPALNERLESTLFERSAAK